MIHSHFLYPLYCAKEEEIYFWSTFETRIFEQVAVVEQNTLIANGSILILYIYFYSWTSTWKYRFQSIESIKMEPPCTIIGFISRCLGYFEIFAFWNYEILCMMCLLKVYEMIILYQVYFVTSLYNNLCSVFFILFSWIWFV